MTDLKDFLVLPPEPPAPPTVPSPTDPPPKSSGRSFLAPTPGNMLDELYGPDSIAFLYNNLDNLALSQEQRALMLELVYGFKQKDELMPEELELLQGATELLSAGRSAPPATQTTPKASAPLRPSWHHSEAEMREDGPDVFTSLHRAKEEPPIGGSS